MLEEQEPFKFALLFLNFCLWKTNSLQKSQKVKAIIAFIVFQPVALIFVLMSFMQNKNMEDFVSSLGMVFSFIPTVTYIVAFWIKNDEIQELIDDINANLLNERDLLKFITEACRKAKKIQTFKVCGFIGWYCISSIETFVMHLIVIPMWQPETLANVEEFFYIRWIYQSLVLFYMLSAGTIVCDVNYNLLMVIEGYSQYLRYKLRSLDATKNTGKMNLIQCVKIHQNLKNLMRIYTEIAAFPIAIFISNIAYIMCAVIFIATYASQNEDVGRLIVFAAIEMLQLFHPCYIANKIEYANANFMNDIMGSQWVNAKLKTKKLLLIFMENLNHPIIKFNLYSVVDVNLKTFLSILNTTYSTYAVLKSMRK